MNLKYIIYNGNDYGLLPNSMEVSINLKSEDNDPSKGYSEVSIKFPNKWDLFEWKSGNICSLVTEYNGGFFLFLDFIVKNVYSDYAVLTSKQYVDFQPIFVLTPGHSIPFTKTPKIQKS